MAPAISVAEITQNCARKKRNISTLETESSTYSCNPFSLSGIFSPLARIQRSLHINGICIVGTWHAYAVTQLSGDASSQRTTEREARSTKHEASRRRKSNDRAFSPFIVRPLHATPYASHSRGSSTQRGAPAAKRWDSRSRSPDRYCEAMHCTAPSPRAPHPIPSPSSTHS